MDTIDMVPGGVVLNIEKGQWHSLKCLESGTCCLRRRMGGMNPSARRISWSRGLRRGHRPVCA